MDSLFDSRDDFASFVTDGEEMDRADFERANYLNPSSEIVQDIISNALDTLGISSYVGIADNIRTSFLRILKKSGLSSITISRHIELPIKIIRAA